MHLFDFLCLSSIFATLLRYIFIYFLTSFGNDSLPLSVSLQALSVVFGFCVFSNEFSYPFFPLNSDSSLSSLPHLYIFINLSSVLSYLYNFLNVF